MNSSSRKRRLKAAAAVHSDNDNDCISSPPAPPTRDCNDLYAVATTLHCAAQQCCVPCAYKVATFDVALDYRVGRSVPNQRPEQCPRATASTTTTTTAAADRQHHGAPPLGYDERTNVLTVGDGDFSFSLALARFGCHVTATSYETRETLLRVYQSVGIEATLAELEQSSGGCSTAFSVDATKLRETLPPSLSRFYQKFDRIVWNFPCSAVAKGQDGQNQEMEHNKDLVQRFVANARGFLSTDQGQIHINHKTKPPFNQWKLEQVVLSAAPNVRYLGRVVLDRYLFPPYVPRKALDRKSFPCHDACTYIFDFQGGGDSSSAVENPLKTMALSEQQAFELLDRECNSSSNNSNTLPPPSLNALVAVTPDLLKSLRARLLQQKCGEQNPSRKKRKLRR